MSQQAQMEWWRPDVVVEAGDRTARSAMTKPGTHDSPVPFWAMMIFSFILLFAPQNYIPALAPFRIALLTAVLAITACLIDRIRLGLPIMRRTPEMWTVICLAAWAVLTIPFSSWPGGSFSFLMEQYFRTLAIFWLLSHTVTTPARLRLVAWGLSLTAIWLGMTAVENYLSPAILQPGEDSSRIAGTDSSLKNPNDLALMLNLILPLNVALFFVSRASMARIILLVSITLGVTAIILTYSRAGFLTLAVTVTLYLWKLRNRSERIWVWAALVAALACTPFLPSSYFDRLSTITDITADRTGSSQERMHYTLAAVDHIFEHPIVGAGLGMNVVALNEERDAKWKAVHNVYLEYAVDLGLPGLMLFLLLVVRCLRNTTFVQRQCEPVPALRELFTLAEGLQVSLIAFAVAAAFHPVAYHFYFYYIGGLAVASKVMPEIDAGRSDVPQVSSIVGRKDRHQISDVVEAKHGLTLKGTKGE
jgi:putative inorganic carbon (HCO3(-)) transporter